MPWTPWVRISIEHIIPSLRNEYVPLPSQNEDNESDILVEAFHYIKVLDT